MIVAILMSAPLLVILSVAGPDILKYRRLAEAGVEGWAALSEVRHSTTRHGNPIHYLSYTYTIDGRSYAGEDQLLYEDGADLLPHRQLPILYDPAFPNRSVVERGPTIESRYKKSLLLPGLLGGTTLVPLLVAFFVISARYFKERRLLKWGLAVRATITGEERCGSSRDGESITLHFQFVDATGTTYRGERKGVPPFEKADALQRALRQRLLTDPVVLYHPKHPELNALYPLDWVELRFEMPIMSGEINALDDPKSGVDDRHRQRKSREP